MDILPNPVYDIANLNFSLAVNGNCSFILTNNLGERLLNIPDTYFEKGNNNIQLNTSKYTSGVYYISIKSADYMKTVPMLIVR